MVKSGLSFQVFDVPEAGEIDQSKQDFENRIVGLRVIYYSQWRNNR